MTGAYAKHCLVAQTDLFHLPADISFDYGASLGTSAMAAYRALITRGEARPGDRVLVHGATGGVGVVAVQLAVRRGMTVVGTADDDKGADLVRQLGATGAFVHSREGYFEKVKALGPFDVVVECLANVNLGRDLEALAKGGRVVVVGSRGKVTVDPRELMVREADVRGVFLPGQTQREKAQAVSDLLAGIKQGTLTPVIAEVLSLEQAPDAHRKVVAPNSGLAGKIILRPPNAMHAKL